MHIAIEDLGLAHLWIVYPGTERFPLGPRLSAWPLQDIAALDADLAARRR